jgi:hypothetical protein
VPRQDTPSVAVLKRQLTTIRHNRFYGMLEKAALEHRLPVPLWLGIASRETNCTNILGDFQHGEYHGVGIVQIDIQHPIARQMRDDGTWKTHPERLIDYGAQELREGISKAHVAFPDFTPLQWCKIAASGYNQGIDGAIADSRHHGDSDFTTTGKNYGADVLRRAKVFADALGLPWPPDSV